MKRTTLAFLILTSIALGSNRAFVNHSVLIKKDWVLEYPKLELPEAKKKIEFKENGECASGFLHGITHWAVDSNSNLYLYARGELLMELKYEHEKKCYIQSTYIQDHPLVIKQKTQPGEVVNASAAAEKSENHLHD